MKGVISWPEEISYIDIFLLMIELQRPNSFREISFKIVQEIGVENDSILLNILSCLLSLWRSEMKPTCMTEGALMIEPVEFIINVKLMLRTHTITVSWYNLGIILNCSYNVGKTMKFSEIFFWSFFDILILIIEISLFFLSLLALLSFISRWSLLLGLSF